ncbi:MAG: NAD(P)/FAD-dependent oxidoreductase [Rhodanobacteraceae bacterium]
MTTTSLDVVIIGAGIAGAAAAAQLSRDLQVVVLERESQPGYHTTGRSAAIFSEIYGNVSIRALSRASRAFFFNPPRGFSDMPLLGRRGWLFVARADQLDRMETFARLPEVAGATKRLSPNEACRLSPMLRGDYVSAGLYEPAASDMDVHALLHGFLRQMRRPGGKLVTNATVLELDHANGRWHVHTSAGEFNAPIVVNAAGAWVDRICAMAGADPIGIEPLRRTAALVDAPARLDISAWPMTIDIDEKFYFKPDAGMVLLSPADETLSAPCDAMPEDWDVAMAVDRIESATTLKITHVRRKWAGLRCFVADRTPVVGYDPVLPGFFWLAALGGYGIQTAPAMGRLAAALIRKRPVPDDILAAGLESTALAPGRSSLRRRERPAHQTVPER